MKADVDDRSKQAIREYERARKRAWRKREREHKTTVRVEIDETIVCKLVKWGYLRDGETTARAIGEAIAHALSMAEK